MNKTIVALWMTTSHEENEYDYILSNIQVDEIYLFGPYQPTNNLLRDKTKVKNASELPTDIPLVLCVPLTARNFTPTINLLDFTHPTDAIYLFGPNNEHLVDEDFGGRVPDHIVYIPTDTTDEMFNYTSCLITLWHRRHG